MAYLGKVDAEPWPVLNHIVLMKDFWGEQELLHALTEPSAPAQGLFPAPKGSTACAQRKICSHRKKVPCNQFESNLEKP